MSRGQCAGVGALAAQIEAMREELVHVRGVVEGHERWHRDSAVTAAHADRSRRIARWAVVIAVLAFLAQVGGTVTTLAVR